MKGNKERTVENGLGVAQSREVLKAATRSPVTAIEYNLHADVLDEAETVMFL